MNADALADVFRRVLETPGIGPDSDFFESGGDSLLATRVLSAVAAACGVELDFDDFLDAPTPAALAKKIASAA
ncbi:acyl carrier protein [Nonomuraea sp. NN258]|uniref:acyl carrier protein n=1 Tax=Nonomuraea antri TaxID=2730852 RepID=UPI0015681371|nr:acyl carrier protein [Nonomuraea antri]NRQ38557.1 acyl carrier protein [Nonomuraea antri]